MLLWVLGGLWVLGSLWLLWVRLLQLLQSLT